MSIRTNIIFATVSTGLIFAQGAQAQTAPPNLGNFQALDGLFRIGIRVNNQLNGFDQAAGFQQNTIVDLETYLDPSEIALRVGQQNAQFGAISAVFDIRGATAVASYQQNGTSLTINVVSPTGQIIQANGAACSFTFNGLTRQQSYDQLSLAVDTDLDPTPVGQALLGCLQSGLARFSPIDPLAGNPGSLQASLTRNALDLTDNDSLVEQGANTAGTPWIVGAAYTTGSAGRFGIDRFDARLQRSFRVLEGSRALLKIDLPFNYSRVNGVDAFSGQIGIGLEVPLISQKWSVEPRIAYGAVYSGDAGSAGHIVQFSATSRFVVQGLGRGRLVIGNMVGYSQTLDVPGTGFNLNPDLKNWSLRNGLAYDLPLKARFFSRSSSLRASYSFTHYFGSELFNNSFHEAALSIGLRGREDSVRASRDLIRLNVSTIQARGYSTYNMGVGFKF